MTIDVVATLGPSGSCSDIVATRNLYRFAGATNIKLYSSYELAFDAVEKDQARVALIAAAYPRLNVLVMHLSRSVVITSSFVDDTPPLVIVGRRVNAADLTEHGGTIACVEAPAPLVNALFPKCQIVAASSNSDAALFAADGRTDAALTTEPAAVKSGLPILHSFGSVPMAWVAFSKCQKRGDSALETVTK
jgi:hypothetical protein